MVRRFLALRLVRFLAEGEPKISYSSPDIPSLPIKDILTGMETDDLKLMNFLNKRPEIGGNEYFPTLEPTRALLFSFR